MCSMSLLCPRMPCEAKHRVLILYGSQKGQAQSIAEGIAAEAADHGLVADVSCLSQHEEVGHTHTRVVSENYCVIGQFEVGVVNALSAGTHTAVNCTSISLILCPMQH